MDEQLHADWCHARNVGYVEGEPACNCQSKQIDPAALRAHHPQFTPETGEESFCWDCRETWPCTTIQLLDRNEELEQSTTAVRLHEAMEAWNQFQHYVFESWERKINELAGLETQVDERMEKAETALMAAAGAGTLAEADRINGVALKELAAAEDRATAAETKLETARNTSADMIEDSIQPDLAEHATAWFKSYAKIFAEVLK